MPAPQAARNDAERAKDGGLRWGGLALRPRCAAYPMSRIALRRAPNREGQSAAMKGVRINETWYDIPAELSAAGARIA